MLNRLPAALRRALIVGLPLAAAACTVTETPTTPTYPVYPQPAPACPLIYAPVCAENWNGRRTFSNSCEAQANGFRIVHAGECVRDRPLPPQACPKIYRPVCGSRAGRFTTFANECTARAAGWPVAYNGECRPAKPVKPKPPAKKPVPLNCSKANVPVCALKNGQVRTFPNECAAVDAGYILAPSEVCQRQ